MVSQHRCACHVDAGCTQAAPHAPVPRQGRFVPARPGRACRRRSVRPQALWRPWAPQGFRAADVRPMGPLKAPPMGLGTWAWGNQFLWGYDESMDAELQAVFNFAVSNGVNLWDTADSYGTGRLNGRSEQLLGRFIAEYPGPAREREGVLVATKLAAYPWRLTPGQFVAAVWGSLRRLGLEQVALGQLHWSTARYAPLQERALWDGLAAMHDEGLVKAVGVSNYGPRQLERIHAYLERRGIPLASAQVQFSLISKGPQQMETKAMCDQLGIRLIAYSPLGLGMLTGKYEAGGALPAGPRALLFRQILPGLGPLLAELRGVAAKRGKTPSQVAINWCMAQGAIPIPGAKTLAQTRDNLGALGWRLSAGEAAALGAAADAAPRGMIQNVFQTR